MLKIDNTVSSVKNTHFIRNMDNRSFVGSNRKPLRIMIAESQSLVRDALHQLIDTWPDMQVIALAENCAEVWDKARQFKPTVIVLDTNIGERDLLGKQVVELSIEPLLTKIRDHLPGVRILLISSYFDDIESQQLLKAGAAGYFLKQSNFQEFAQAVRTVALGGSYLDPNIQRQTSSSLGESLLSSQEVKILTMTAQGYGNLEVADRLGCSPKTVEGYKSKIAIKMEFESRADWVRYAVRRGWLAEN